jgi:glycosyltransferase involved in cell wall biosynthesis
MMNTHPYIIIPAKDEEPRLGKVLEQVIGMGYSNIVIVDDGSVDETSNIARAYDVTVLNHRLNLGAGAATQTGIHWALKQGADVLVTMDGDTQHDAEYIPELVSKLVNDSLDLVIGSRFLEKDPEIPVSRLFYNKIANVITWILTGMSVSDSQSGMRVMTADFARKSELHWNGFEFCIEQLRYARRHGAKIGESPIKAYYTHDTIHKGQNLITGIRMLGTLVRRHTHI